MSNNKVAFVRGFFDEMEKLGWFGTYYHGTSPEATKAILKEGLKTSKGGSGAAEFARKHDAAKGHVFAESRPGRLGDDEFDTAFRRQLDMPYRFGSKIHHTTEHPFVRRSRGKIHMTPSKTHAKIYQALLNPEIHGDLPEGKLNKAKEIGRRVLKVVTDQPLQVKGVPKEKLSRDPDDPLAVVSTEDIPAGQVQRAKSIVQRAKDLLRRGK